MKINLEYLKTFIDVHLSPRKFKDFVESMGIEVDEITEHDGSSVFELEVTPNRPDWLSHWGIARDMAAKDPQYKLKPDTPLFANFNQHLVKKVLICYDNDAAGHKASKVAAEIARKIFSRTTQIDIFSYKENHPEGYDLTDLLREGINPFDARNQQMQLTF